MRTVLLGNVQYKNMKQADESKLVHKEKRVKNKQAKTSSTEEYSTVVSSPCLEVKYYMKDNKIIEKEERSNEGVVIYTYTYLPSGHLQRVRRNKEIVEEYHYNKKGQRICDKIELMGKKPRDFIYNGRGELIESAGVEYEYNKGKLARVRYGSQEVLLHYGDDTLLDGVRMPNGDEIVYQCQELNPIKKYKNKSLVEEYVWENTLCLREYTDYNKNSHYEFIYRENRVPIGMVVQGALARKLCGNDAMNLSFGYDHLGTIKRIYNEYGALVKCIDYDSFGNILFENNVDFFLPLGFACGLRDRDTSFIRYCYRDYYPYIGRFTCIDPAKDYGTDGDYYDYCSDDPVTYFDPLGLMGYISNYWNSKDEDERETLVRGVVRDVSPTIVAKGLDIATDLPYLRVFKPFVRVATPMIKRGVDNQLEEMEFPQGPKKNISNLIKESALSGVKKFQETRDIGEGIKAIYDDISTNTVDRILINQSHLNQKRINKDIERRVFEDKQLSSRDRFSIYSLRGNDIADQAPLLE
ncbi:MAG: hypothetical protein K2M30_02830, partial [Desulfovibrionaceae bacterium]|nr:hypothetical protein [Desulfovibrionaceae bacterium]